MKMTIYLLTLSIITYLHGRANAAGISTNWSVPVARILNVTIVAEQGVVDASILKTNSSGAIVHFSVNSVTNIPDDVLYNLVITALARDYIKTHRLNATDDEIHTFKAYQDEFMAKELERWQEQLKSLKAQVEDKTLTHEDFKKNEERISRLKKLIDREQKRGQMSKVADDESQSTYGPIIEAWKFNNSIYQNYGGIVAMTKFGPDPIGAKKELITHYQDGGKLEIFDPLVRSNFWNRVGQPPHLEAKQSEISFIPFWILMLRQMK